MRGSVAGVDWATSGALPSFKEISSGRPHSARVILAGLEPSGMASCHADLVSLLFTLYSGLGVPWNSFGVHRVRVTCWFLVNIGWLEWLWMAFCLVTPMLCSCIQMHAGRCSGRGLQAVALAYGQKLLDGCADHAAGSGSQILENNRGLPADPQTIS